MKFGKFLKFIKATIIFTIIFMWIFSGWPQVMEFPPDVKMAQAATYTETFSTAGNFTWIAPIGVTTTTVEVWGAGGGGSIGNAGGGGGGGGAYASAVVNVTPGNAYSITVGAGGLTDTVSAGNNSTFATTSVIADGGSGTNGNTKGAAGLAGNSSGTIVFSGGGGGLGNTTGDVGAGGGGAAGPNGTGATSSDATANTPTAGGAGNAGSGGAGGTAGSGTTCPGGAGGPGENHANGGGGGGGADGDGTNTCTGGIGGNPGGGGGSSELTGATQTGGDGQVRITYTIWTVLDNGTDPSNSTVAPASTGNYVDQFTFAVSTSTDSVTALTVTTANTSAVANVQIWNEAMTTQYFSTVSSPTGDTWSFSGGTAMPTITTSTAFFRVVFTAKDHSLASGTYGVTGYVSAFTSTNAQSLTDSADTTITIDNLAPNGATATSGSAGDAQVTLNWTTSNSNDFSRSVVFRWTGASAGSETPSEGVDYNVGDATSTATIVCVRTSDASSTAVSGVDGAGTGGCSAVALTNGQAYTYKVFQKDSYGNYDIGVSIGTFTPNIAATISCSTNISATSFSNLTTASVFTSSPNASTTMSCANTSSGCTLYVKDAGNGSNPGLATSSPAYLIPSTTATLSAGTEGYGIQATTTASGSGGVLNINAIYNKAGNDVGGLSLSNVVIASSTADISNREVVTTHKATISNVTISGNYSDTITYSCFVN